ncbi:MAG: hypothetical protein WAN72_13465 [Candidatus Acidiferrales bacterium]
MRHLLVSATVLAQQVTPPQSAQPAQQAQQPALPATDGTAGSGQAASSQKQGHDQNSPKPGQDSTTQSKDRLFYTLPNFLALENADKVPPLTAGDKFKLITRSSFDPAQFAWYGLISAIGQAQNSEPAYGQGWGAYGKRYAHRNMPLMV